MSKSLERIIVLLGLTALLAIVNTSCNTAHGFGKDVTSTGDAIQHGTE
jgi:predicted small secreted protein